MGTAAKIGYARVSTEDQKLDLQLEQLRALTLDRVFEDKASGKNLERPAFVEMMNYVREGDILYVCSMDRLARNLQDLLEVTQRLQNKGVTVHFLKENLMLSPEGEGQPISKLLLSMMGAVAEFERSLIRERQREGIEIAKKRGAYKGRKPLDEKLVEEARKLYQQGVPISTLARRLNVSRPSLYKYLR
jgi:DNA invertase Pin-like site-specific DNA recombinase